MLGKVVINIFLLIYQLMSQLGMHLNPFELIGYGLWRSLQVSISQETLFSSKLGSSPGQISLDRIFSNVSKIIFFMEIR